ncbi:MAG: MBL fold metallo-hydrolase [Lachnospiraceae bacterium]|nr:MBL fold metallo-hydrolase [Lachnospiraceae bacterium]
MIKSLQVSMCQTNCYYFHKQGETEAVCVDPGDHGEWIFERLQEDNLQLAGILLTHGHFDHMMGAEALQKLSGAKIYAYEAEREVCEDPMKNLTALWGMPPYKLQVDEYLKANTVFTMAGMEFKLLPTPGHTIGGCCYYLEKEEVLFCGDTVFQCSIGRTDLPTGSESALMRSIDAQIVNLPEDTILLPGHGDTSTVAFEKQNSPFFRALG